MEKKFRFQKVPWEYGVPIVYGHVCAHLGKEIDLCAGIQFALYKTVLNALRRTEQQLLLFNQRGLALCVYAKTNHIL